jgi:hypothetical protein
MFVCHPFSSSSFALIDKYRSYAGRRRQHRWSGLGESLDHCGDLDETSSTILVRVYPIRHIPSNRFRAA